MVEEGLRIRVSGPGIFRQQPCIRFFGRMTIPNPRRRPAFPDSFLRQSPRLPLHAAAAGKALKGTRLAETHRAVLRQPQVSDLAAHVRAAPQKPSFGDHSAAHAGAHGQEDHVAASPARAQLPFHQRAGVGIVLQIDRNAAAFFQQGLQRDIHPAGQIGRAEHHAPPGIQRPAAAYAYGVHVRIGKAVFLKDFLHGRRQLGINRLKSPLRAGCKAQLVLQMNAAVYRRQQHSALGSADVQPHPVPLHSVFPPNPSNSSSPSSRRHFRTHG